MKVLPSLSPKPKCPSSMSINIKDFLQTFTNSTTNSTRRLSLRRSHRLSPHLAESCTITGTSALHHAFIGGVVSSRQPIRRHFRRQAVILKSLRAKVRQTWRLRTLNSQPGAVKSITTSTIRGLIRSRVAASSPPSTFSTWAKG